MPPKKIQTRQYKSPLDIPYIKALILDLNILGSWPHKRMGHKKWFTDYRNSKFLFIYISAVFYFQSKYAFKSVHTTSFLQQGRLYMNLSMIVVTLSRLCTGWTKLFKEITFNLINKIHLFHHKDKSDFAKKTYEDVEKLSSLLSKFIHCELFFGILLYNIVPLYNSYTKGMFNSVKPPNATYDQAGHYDLPLDYTTNFNGFLIVYIFNWFISSDVAFCFCIFDLYIFIIVLQLWGHLKILKHNLGSFPKPRSASAWYNKEESQEVRKLLLESMEHYKMIKDFMNDFSMGFGAMICVYYTYYQVMGCVLLVELSQMSAEAIGTFGITTLNTYQQLIQMSVLFELIGSQSETIKDALYEVPWECMGTDNRKIVLMYLCNVQTPMNFKALGILPIGVTTMASILRTSFSYFMLLRTSTAGQQ